MVTLLERINEVLFAAVLIVSFSLLAYIVLQNWRSDIVRALGVLLSGVIIAYSGDLLLARAQRPETIEFLGRAQWLGIVLVPAGYIHFANALLAFGNANALAQRWRRGVYLAYAGSLVIFLLVAFGTNLVIHTGMPSGPIAQFQAGPLFWFYVVFFTIAAATALVAILITRRSALTPSQRRRLSYLGATFAAPGIGAFPFLLIASPNTISPVLILALQAIASMIVIVMVTVMTYSVAFQGMLIPERLIKQDFVRWWLYGPFVGIATILFIQTVPILAQALGLPQETLITFGVMVMTVLMPIFVTQAKPYLDALIYRQDHSEIDYLRNLPRNMFTRADLRALLENSLVAICNSLQVPTGFVIAPGEDGFSVKAVWGSRREVRRFITENPIASLIPQLEAMPCDVSASLDSGSFVVIGSFCLLPLRSPDGVFLGAIGLEATAEQLRRNGGMSADMRRMVTGLAHQIELALTTVQMQRQIFDALRGLAPEMQSLQQLSSRLEQATPGMLAMLEDDIVMHPDFTQLVKDALTQFWGGPKLADSPLLSLRSVRRVLAEQGGSPTRALQAVLRQAIANLRPDDQIDPSAQEWLLYNLLEGRFLRRQTVRDVAHRLAMSESDFYRKQRIAIEEVARQILLMEEHEYEHSTGRR
ncbi:MAG: hypothetical protein K6356_10910 [Chloroflexus sp.]